LSNKKAGSIPDRISSIYKEYIRFVNQIYFREVTAQDQGIELYDLMQKCLKIKEYIKDLDNEIEELHRYVSLMEERERNRKIEWLNIIATVLLPATLITGLFGMNYGKGDYVIKSFGGQFVIVAGVITIAVIYFMIRSLIKRNKL
jgi:Mg2+ and Co2+ transporter CorA